LGGGVGILINVEAIDGNLTLQQLGDLLQNRGEHPTRTTPGCPTIDQNRVGGSENFFLKIVVSEGEHG
jgi:hypothetical protein